MLRLAVAAELSAALGVYEPERYDGVLNGELDAEATGDGAGEDVSCGSTPSGMSVHGSCAQRRTSSSDLASRSKSQIGQRPSSWKLRWFSAEKLSSRTKSCSTYAAKAQVHSKRFVSSAVDAHGEEIARTPFRSLQAKLRNRTAHAFC